MQKEVRLTKEGLENLQKELDFLKTTKRDEIAEKIEIARSYGDLSENAEYDEAKNDQAVVEARIAEIDNMLKNAVVIENVDTGKVRPGATVVVKNLKMNKEITYKIVGSNIDLYQMFLLQLYRLSLNIDNDLRMFGIALVHYMF